ncbi:MAG: N4-gp56 family major capsid protein [Clostridia bacterium]|nr:N4-gp56 family major capsid protein [Clostridia bacterium]
MIFKTILNLFDSYAVNVNTGASAAADYNVNRSSDAELSSEMKTYYSAYLIDLAEPLLVHDQFGQKRPIPANNGKQVEFRKYSTLPKLTTPLTEGVTPDGQKLSVSVITSEVHQYGGYIALSDVLLLTAIDKNLVEATKLLASQAGRTLDTITREVVNGGTQVVYAGGGLDRSALVGGAGSGNNYITVVDVRKAVRALKVMNAPKIDGRYVGIIHPDVAFDLMNDPDWKYPHQYKDTTNIYTDEIGEIGGVRFVETTEAKIFKGKNLAGETRNLAVNGAVTANTQKTITFDGGTVASNALKGRQILVDGKIYTVASNTPTVITVSGSANLPAIADNTVIYPAEGGAAGRAVYSTLIIGENAYGVTEIEGGGLQHIVKQLGAGEDPLNQRATAGWKAIKTAVILVDEYLCRIESTSTYDEDDK